MKKHYKQVGFTVLHKNNSLGIIWNTEDDAKVMTLTNEYYKHIVPIYIEIPSPSEKQIFKALQRLIQSNAPTTHNDIMFEAGYRGLSNSVVRAQLFNLERLKYITIAKEHRRKFKYTILRDVE